ncbi:hypothetical protein ACYCSE_17465 [Paenibacillus sp. SEL1]
MGTSIPNQKNETASRGQGDVKTYTLSPEELAEIVGKPIPKSHIKPLTFRAKTKTIKEEIPVAKASKNEYLKLRAEALSRADAARKLGITMNSLRSYWLPKWDIKTPEAEEVAIARYKESIKAKTEDDPKPTVPVAEVAAETLPVTQPDGPYKPVLSKAEDEAIKWLLTEWDKQSLLHEHAAAPNGWQVGTQAEALNGMSVWLLAQALISGYTVELTMEERMKEAFEETTAHDGCFCGESVAEANGFHAGFITALEIAGIKVSGITD